MDCGYGNTERSRSLVQTGLILYGLSAAFSLVDTHFAVRRNRTASSTASTDSSTPFFARRSEVVPLLRPDSRGRLVPGLQAALRF